MKRPTDDLGIAIRDVFAHFGAAMYAAQCVERQLVIQAPMLLRMHPHVTTRAELDGLWDRMFGQTMGGTYRELERKGVLPVGCEGRLKEALRLRNWLAHNYFWDRATDFMTASGRERMRTELAAAAATLHGLDEELTDMSHDWRREVGVTDEVLAAELRRMMDIPPAV